MLKQRQILGTCSCPVCKTPGQEIRASDKGKPYVMCDECDVQIFARSSRSAAAMMKLAAPTKPADPSPVPKDTPPAVKPVQEKSREEKSAAGPAAGKPAVAAVATAGRNKLW